MEEFKRKVLFNKLEYVALFRLNRPIQTFEESVKEYKTAQQDFKKLVQFVKDSNNERELNWANQLAETIKSMQENIAQDEENNKLGQRQKIDRARRANRTMLADAISVINNEYTKFKEAQVKEIKDAHDRALEEAKQKIKGRRLDIIAKNDGILKLKSQMTKMQVILRKNNLVSEISLSQSNSGTTKTMIESLQQKLLQREDNIKALIAQITRLQSMRQTDRRKSSALMGAPPGIIDDEEEPLVEEESFDLSSLLPDFTNVVPVSGNLDILESSRGSIAQSRGSSFLGVSVRGSNANRRGSMMREKRASILTSRKESTQVLPLPAIEIKQTLEEKLMEIAEKYEKIISIEQSRHDDEVKEIMEQIDEINAVASVSFKDELSFSKKRLSENRNFQKHSLELLNNIQGLFPMHIHPSKVSSYTQCDLDDTI